MTEQEVARAAAPLLARMLARVRPVAVTGAGVPADAEPAPPGSAAGEKRSNTCTAPGARASRTTAWPVEARASTSQK